MKNKTALVPKALTAALGLVLMAPAAFAQSNVTISGAVKAGWENYKLRNVSGASAENAISDQSSRIIFAGTEDLGGGMKAWFQLDARFLVDVGGNNSTGTTNTWAAGNTGVGLMGNWGKLTVGRWDLHYSEFGAIESNRAGSLQTQAGAGLLSQVNGTNITPVSRTPNLVMWDSPNWNGVTARLAYSTAFAGNEGSGANDGSKHGAWNAVIRYAQGPLTAGYSHWDAKVEGTAQGTIAAPVFDQRADRAWFGYTLPFGLKVGLGVDRSRLDARVGTDRRRTAWLLPITYSFGPHAVYATYARAGSTDGVAGDTKASQYTVGYDYAFSKRTSVGAFYTQLSNGGAAAYNFYNLGQSGRTPATAGQDPRQFYIGMAHSF